MAPRVWVFVSLACLLASAALAQPSCDDEIDCEYSKRINDIVYTWDFRNLCNPNADYFFQDGDGHDYYAQICGQAAAQCLPATWKNKFEYGVAVQMWGDVPTCNQQQPECIDQITQQPACCTADCQVIGEGFPHYALLDTTNPNAGLTAQFTTVPPDPDDPFWCPWNPQTGTQFNREVHYQFTCKPQFTGLAQPVRADQNSSDNCRYTLVFDTAYGCANYVPSGSGSGSSSGLSGGWVFVIVVLVGGTVYLAAGAIWTYSRERRWGLPNALFWGSVRDNVVAGVSFVGNGFKPVDTQNRTAYDQIGSSGGGSSSGTFTSGAYQSGDAGLKPSAYTEL